MIVHPDIENYLNQLSPAIHPVLSEMEARARAIDFPIMGPLVGRLLYFLVEYGHVHRILECGSGFGYSALWMALALPENGNITCIEKDPRNIELAKKYFEEAGQLHKLNFLEGDALEILTNLSGTYDMIVNDIYKEQYPQSLPLILPRLRVGGILVTDNLLWKGDVANTSPTDPKTPFIKEYNSLIFSTPELFSTILPLRDGVGISIKLKTGND